MLHLLFCVSGLVALAVVPSTQQMRDVSLTSPLEAIPSWCCEANRLNVLPFTPPITRPSSNAMT